MAGRVQTWIQRNRITGPFVQARRRRRRVKRWVGEGRPAPPVHAYKQQVVLDYARRFHLRTLVETGTWRGDMVEAALLHFDRIVSIELSAKFAAHARERFRRIAKVEIVEGDSAVRLPDVLPSLRLPALFWLDGHFSGADTAKGSVDSPLRDEVESILRHSVRGHVILIDDARHLSGEDGYPTPDELGTLVRAHWPDGVLETEHDIARIARSE